MSLSSDYPDDFLKLWDIYPRFPVGRSKKRPSYESFVRAKKRCNFTPEDIEAIRLNIEDRKRHCTTWQTGNKYGPPMFSTYMNQELWNEPFERLRWHPSHKPLEATEAPAWQAKGFPSPEAYRAHVDRVMQEELDKLRVRH